MCQTTRTPAQHAPTSMASRIATQTQAFTEEEHALLLTAIERWHDATQFSNEQVDQVKALFRRVFGLSHDTLLVGSALPDAIVLQSPGNRHRFYALVYSGPWEAVRLESDALVEFKSGLEFSLLLHFLSDSTGGLTSVPWPKAGF